MAASNHRRVALAAALLSAAIVPAAASASPNLVTTSVDDPPARVAQGGILKVRDAVENRGSRAGRSATRYYLTSDPARSLRERRASSADPREALGDLLLEGSRPVAAAAAGASSVARTRPAVTVVVPLGTPAGRYRLLACADDRGAVRESAEADNCRAAAAAVRVVAPVGGEALVTDVFSALRDPQSDGADAQLLTARRALECAPRPVARRLTLAQALRSAETFLRTRAGAGSFAALDRSPDARSAVRLEQAAARALVASRPGAALAALLRAHERDPREASHLAHAGVVATTLGLPSEGLAMTQSAQLLDQRGRPAMGLSRQAVSLANRGQALVALGQFDAAAPVLDRALALEPFLTEATRTRAISRLCTAATAEEGVRQALAPLRAARLRPGQVDPPLDESQGRESALRAIPLPDSPQDAVRLHPVYLDWQSRRMAAEVRVLGERRRATLLKTLSRRPGETGAEWWRRSRVMLGVSAVPLRPANKASLMGILEHVRRAHDIGMRFWGPTIAGIGEQANRECAGRGDAGACAAARRYELCVPAFAGAHREWLGEMQAARSESETRQRVMSREISGVAANLADPAAHDFGAIVIDEQEHNAAHTLMGSGLEWTAWLTVLGHAQDCVPAGGPPPADPSALSDAPAAAATAPCPAALKAFNAVVDLGDAKLKIACEKLTLEASTPVAPWMDAFGEVKFDQRAGTLTVVFGAKAKAGAGPIKASFKSGIYLTVGAEGVQDVGWRIGPSLTAGAGPVEFKADDQMSLTFLGTTTADGRW